MMRVRKKKLPKGISERILKDGSRVYVGRVQVNGRRHTVTNASMKEVKKEMEKLKYELKNNIYVEPAPKQVVKKITLNEWFNIWLKDYKSIRIKKRTLEHYALSYNKHIKKDFGAKYLDDITVDQVQRFINGLAKNNLSSGTIQYIATIFSGAMKQAVKSERIAKNPFDHITMPKKGEQKKKNILSLEHEKILLKYCKNELFKQIIIIALYTGMRVGEILGLTWEDIDFGKELIHVRHTLVNKNKNNYYLSSPKSKTSVREIPMLSNVLELLNGIKPSEAGEKDFIFNKSGKPIPPASLSSHIKYALAEIKKDGTEIKHMSMHSFRHTFATRCIRQGMTPQTLKTIMGHANLSITMDLYAHVETDIKQKEMLKLEKIV